VDQLIVSLGVDLDTGREPVGLGGKEQVGAIGKKTVGSMSKFGPEWATIVLKPSLSERVVLDHKSVRARGPKNLGQIEGEFNGGKGPAASWVKRWPKLKPTLCGLRKQELGRSLCRGRI
jgi:hypothetical protein